MSILKVDYSVSIFFRFLTCLYLNLKFVSNTFWTKIPKSSHCVAWASSLFSGYLSESYKISEINPPLKSLGGRSKSQDAIRNHRKTVRFVSDKQQYQPILDSTNIGGYNGGGSRPDGRSELGHSGPGGGGVKGRSFFLLSMLQGGDPSSSSGRAKSSKVTTFLHFFFSLPFFFRLVSSVIAMCCTFALLRTAAALSHSLIISPT